MSLIAEVALSSPLPTIYVHSVANNHTLGILHPYHKGKRVTFVAMRDHATLDDYDGTSPPQEQDAFSATQVLLKRQKAL